MPRSVAPEVAAAHPEVQNQIAPRLAMLMEIANTFLVTIMDSLEAVPYGIRWICKQIRSLTRVSLLTLRSKICSRDMIHLAEIPGCDRLCYMLADWRVLFSSLYQSGHRYSSSLHVDQQSAPLRKASTADVDINSQDASESGQQAILCKRAIYDGFKSIR